MIDSEDQEPPQTMRISNSHQLPDGKAPQQAETSQYHLSEGHPPLSLIQQQPATSHKHSDSSLEFPGEGPESSPRLQSAISETPPETKRSEPGPPKVQLQEPVIISKGLAQHRVIGRGNRVRRTGAGKPRPDEPKWNRAADEPRPSTATSPSQEIVIFRPTSEGSKSLFDSTLGFPGEGPPSPRRKTQDSGGCKHSRPNVVANGSGPHRKPGRGNRKKQGQANTKGFRTPRG